jgi:hypothetical protein
MNGALLIHAVIIALWILLSLIIGYQDLGTVAPATCTSSSAHGNRKSHAMRRMADQEGDA